MKLTFQSLENFQNIYEFCHLQFYKKLRQNNLLEQVLMSLIIIINVKEIKI